MFDGHKYTTALSVATCNIQFTCCQLGKAVEFMLFLD